VKGLQCEEVNEIDKTLISLLLSLTSVGLTIPNLRNDNQPALAASIIQ
jgi:hypothetical protein